MEKNELLMWSKNHIEYLKRSVELLHSIIQKQWKNNNETIKVDALDLHHLNQLIVDSVDIISSLNKI